MSDADTKRRSRLRWVTLGEAVAIAAVIISALTLYFGWQDRRDARADKQAESARAASPAPFNLKATAEREGARLSLTPLDDGQAIQAQAVRFPPALGLPPVTTSGDARIEAGWFASSLKAARRKRGLPDETTGDARLPVMIATDHLAGGGTQSSRAYYDVGYVLEGRLLGGHTVRLRGLRLIAAAPPGTAAVDRRLDTLWASRD